MIRDLFQLLRSGQWYKNFLVFLAIIFSGNLFDFNMFFLTVMGLLSLCLVSSVNYIINDIIDAEKDMNHREKRKRPIADGRIGVGYALIGGIFLFAASSAIALFISKYFFLLVVILFFLSLIYSVFLRDEPFLDILAIAVNFVIRAISGAVIIGVWISPWLILCPFFLSLFLSLGKRKADSLYLGGDAYKYKKTLRYYGDEVTNSLMIMTTTILVVCFSLYSILSGHEKFLIALPFVLYVLFRYLYLVFSGSSIARNPEEALKDVRLMFMVLLMTVITFLAIYF